MVHRISFPHRILKELFVIKIINSAESPRIYLHKKVIRKLIFRIAIPNILSRNLRESKLNYKLI